MEKSELKVLLQASESETLEFKPRLSAKNRHSKEEADLKAKKATEHRILKSIAGLLNCVGGTLVVGVDKHGVPNGKLLEGFQNADEAEVHLTNLVVENLGPLAAAHTRVTFHNVDGHSVLVIECPFNVDVFPVYVSQGQSASDRILYVRVNNSTREYSGEDSDQIYRLYQEEAHPNIRNWCCTERFDCRPRNLVPGIQGTARAAGYGEKGTSPNRLPPSETLNQRPQCPSGPRTLRPTL